MTLSFHVHICMHTGPSPFSSFELCSCFRSASIATLLPATFSSPRTSRWKSLTLVTLDISVRRPFIEGRRANMFRSSGMPWSRSSMVSIPRRVMCKWRCDCWLCWLTVCVHMLVYCACAYVCMHPSMCMQFACVTCTCTYVCFCTCMCTRAWKLNTCSHKEIHWHVTSGRLYVWSIAEIQQCKTSTLLTITLCT